MIGKVAEWLKARLSKSRRGESLSRVRIPPFPPLKLELVRPVIRPDARSDDRANPTLSAKKL